MQIIFTEKEHDWVEVKNGVLRVKNGCPKTIREAIENKLKKILDYYKRVNLPA